MDPTIQLCRIKTSFDRNLEKVVVPEDSSYFELSNSNEMLEISAIQNDDLANSIRPGIVNEEMYSAYLEKRVNPNNESNVFNELKKENWPGNSRIPEISTLPNLTFLPNDDILTMANLDAISDLTNHLGGLASSVGQLIYETNIYYLDLNGAPGAFERYMAYRAPLSVGFGFAEEDWNKCYYMSEQFTPLYSPNKDHLLHLNIDVLAKEVNKISERPIELVLGSVAGPLKETNYVIRTLSEIVMGLKVLVSTGTLVLRVVETYSESMVSLLYILSVLFERIQIILPVLSSYKFVVCKNLTNRNRGYILNELNSIMLKMSSSKDQLVISTPIRPEFLNYLRSINDSILIWQSNLLTENLSGSYAIERCFTYWNLDGAIDERTLSRFAIISNKDKKIIVDESTDMNMGKNRRPVSPRGAFQRKINKRIVVSASPRSRGILPINSERS